jgi:ABC-type transporter Mla MlaB component
MRGIRKFSLTSFREAQRTVVRACGRLIVGQGADQDLWAAHVDEATAAKVALDLSCVNDIDARGLGLLAGLVDRARARGTIVSVMAASRVVQRLAELTRLDLAVPGAWHERMGVLGCRTAGLAGQRTRAVAKVAGFRRIRQGFAGQTVGFNA